MPTMSTVPTDRHYFATGYEFRINPQSGAVPVEYYHVVFTPPAPLGQPAYHNKAVIYGLLSAAAAETLLTLAADPEYPGARIGVTAAPPSITVRADARRALPLSAAAPAVGSNPHSAVPAPAP
jgi:hypothetical protein